MNVLKKIIIICACIAMLSVNLDVVTAEASTYVGKVYNKEGGFLGIGATKYTYKLYYEGNCDIAMYRPINY